jgi:hypothetical protein
VRRARAAHDDGEDVDLGTWSVDADGICEGCVFVCVFGALGVSVSFEVGVSVGYGFP